MPVGNIDPRNDSFTTSSMLLGSEEYPATTQQYEGKNAGYLLYAPRLLYSAGSPLVNSVTTGTIHNLGWLNEGKYDVYAYCRVEGAINGTVSVVFDGTTIAQSLFGASSAGTTMVGSISGFSVSSAAVYLGYVSFLNLTDAKCIRGISVYSRQYEA